MSVVIDASVGITTNSTFANKIPSGTESERPDNPIIGLIRLNTDTNALEIYNGVWAKVTSL